MKRITILVGLLLLFIGQTIWAQTGPWTEDPANNTVYLTNTGNSVGIGTTNPNQELDVNGNVHVSERLGIGPDTPWHVGRGIYLDSAAGREPAKIYWDDRSDTGFQIYEDGDANILYFTSTKGGGSQEEWRWRSAGLGDLMSIGSTIIMRRDLERYASGTVNSSGEAVLAKGIWDLATSWPSASIRFGHINYGSYLAFQTYHQSDWADHVDMVIKEGNVGIGTNDPTQKLDVTGTVRLSASQPILQLWDTSSNSWKFEMKADADRIQFQKYDPSGNWIPNAELMVITKDGNVGIGTYNPSDKLSVRGTIKAQKVVVSTSNWSDRVFTEGYSLMPLREVEQSIQQNKHLPGIPSEETVLQNGIDVGEMQTKLLQKIEELTLYMIEQDKKIESQQEILLRLQQENKLLRQRLSALEQ